MCGNVIMCNCVQEIKSVNIWNQSILDTIMVYGNNLYTIISKSINKSYLLLTDVPEFVEMKHNTFCLEYSDSFSGALFMNVSSYPYVTLENALHEVFNTLNYNSCLLTISMNTVAIMMPFPDVFEVFDSQYRDVHGMSSTSGHCILISLEGIQNLVQYFHITSHFEASNNEMPFELEGVNCVVDSGNDIVGSVFLDNAETVGTSESNQVLDKKQAELLKNRLRKEASRNSESPEKREQRLAKSTEYVKQKRFDELEQCNNLSKVQRQNESLEK